MFDPTQTQPLSWRMQDGQPKPWGEVPMEPTDRRAPSFDDAPPDRLSEGGYRLRGRIGSGRLGAIYEAQDELSRISGSRHFVAIQLVDERIAQRPGFAERFEDGATELKSVAHPNIVRLLEYGRDRNRYYLIHELLESASLRFVLNDAGVLPLPETAAVLRAVGDALQYLHAKGLVHGNLRPEQVLVTFGYEVKLLDIAPNGWLLGPTDALGVPTRAPDTRDDVFGIGCLAYEMLSGRHPFNGNSAREAYRAGIEAPPIEGLSDRQWRALEAALAVHRDDRTPNVAQFLKEFGVENVGKLRAVVAAPADAQAGAPPAATFEAAEPPAAPMRPVLAERASPVRPQRRGGAGQLVLLLLVIAGAFAAWYYRDPLQAFVSDLATEVEARMAGGEAPAARSATAPADPSLAQAPTVTADVPATVLAPGASLPEPAAPEAAAETVADLAPGAVPARSPPPVSTRPALSTADAETGPETADAGGTPAAALPIPAPSPPAATPAPVSPRPARFEFAQSTLSVREGDVAARVTIRRGGDLSRSAEVSWWTEGGSAVADADYADLGARIERFAPGEANRTVYVPLTNDGVREPAKRFTVLLGRGDGEVLGRVQVEIADDD